MRKLVVVAIVIAVLGGAVALVITSKPKLDDARDRVDHSWRALSPSVSARANQLATLVAAVEAASGPTSPTRPPTAGIERDLMRWRRALAAKDLDQQAVTADALEAGAGRLRTFVQASARLARTQAVADALTAFDQTAPPPPLVASYDDAVRRYERAREGVFRQVVARAFGYGSRPTYEPSLPGQ